MLKSKWTALNIFVFLFLALNVNAQKEPIRQIYEYQGENDKAMIMAKTDLFLLNVLSSERFTMEVNSQGEDHLDVALSTPYEKGTVSTRVRYDFLKQGYVVSLSNTKLKPEGKEVIPVEDEANPLHKKLLEQYQKLFFTTYQTEMAKSEVLID